MSFQPRAASLYVQTRTIRRLKWIAKATTDKTADDFADRLLNEVIEERWPEVRQLEEEYQQAEERLRASLKREIPEA